jgi:hypothetical protein
LKEIECEGANWIYINEGRGHWWALVNCNEPLVQSNMGNFLTTKIIQGHCPIEYVNYQLITYQGIERSTCTHVMPAFALALT